MRSTRVKDILDRIDDVLALGTTNSSVLWNILTALRGPDLHIAGAPIKHRTTSIFRHMVFPKAGNNLSKEIKIASFVKGSISKRTIELTVPDGSNWIHFQSHLTAGLASLETIRRDYAREFNVIKRILGDIDDILLENSQDSIDLWNILTGLRGPDIKSKDSDTIKHKTTERIRALAFPKSARARWSNIVLFNNSNSQFKHQDFHAPNRDWLHFYCHVEAAIKSLHHILPDGAVRYKH